MLPYISAGASFQTGIAIGKFHGVIRPTTPSGRRCVDTCAAGERLLEELADRPERLARRVAQDLRRAQRLAARLAQRLAHLDRHVVRDLLGARLERGRGRDEVRAALRERQRRPGRECVGRRADGPSASSGVDDENSPTISDGRIGFVFV